MTIESRLAEIRARVEASTEGPWKFEQGGHSSCGEPACCSEDWDNRIWANGAVLLEDYQLTAADAELIVASRTDLPALLAAVEAVMDIHVERERRRLDGAYSGGMFCIHCRRSWPCPTVRALTAALGRRHPIREDQTDD